jgi:hypothetical protein
MLSRPGSVRRQAERIIILAVRRIGGELTRTPRRRAVNVDREIGRYIGY